MGAASLRVAQAEEAFARALSARLPTTRVRVHRSGAVHAWTSVGELVFGARSGFARVGEVEVAHRGPLALAASEVARRLDAPDLGARCAALRSSVPEPLPDAGLLDASTCRRVFAHPTEIGHHREGALLAPWTSAYAAHYGLPLRLKATPSQPSVAFPDLRLAQSLFLRAPAAFTEWARGRAYLQDLGMDVGPSGYVDVVPTPAEFRRRVRALGLPEPLRPTFAPDPALVIPPARWLAHLRRRRLPIHLRAEWKYRLGAPAREVMHRVYAPWRVKWHTHFHAFGHDMSLHGLALHRLPAAALEALLERAGRARGRGVRAAADFFETTLTRRCVELWREVDEPEAFADAFERVFPELERALETACG